MKFALSKIEEQCEDSGKQRDSGRGVTLICSKLKPQESLSA